MFFPFSLVARTEPISSRLGRVVGSQADTGWPGNIELFKPLRRKCWPSLFRGLGKNVFWGLVCMCMEGKRRQQEVGGWDGFPTRREPSRTALLLC